MLIMLILEGTSVFASQLVAQLISLIRSRMRTFGPLGRYVDVTSAQDTLALRQVLPRTNPANLATTRKIVLSRINQPPLSHLRFLGRWN